MKVQVGSRHEVLGTVELTPFGLVVNGPRIAAVEQLIHRLRLVRHCRSDGWYARLDCEIMQALLDELPDSFQTVILEQ